MFSMLRVIKNSGIRGRWYRLGDAKQLKHIFHMVNMWTSSPCRTDEPKKNQLIANLHGQSSAWCLHYTVCSTE